MCFRKSATCGLGFYLVWSCTRSLARLMTSLTSLMCIIADGTSVSKQELPTQVPSIESNLYAPYPKPYIPPPAISSTPNLQRTPPLIPQTPLHLHHTRPNPHPHQPLPHLRQPPRRPHSQLLPHSTPKYLCRSRRPRP
jgi:hypothetical protein